MRTLGFHILVQLLALGLTTGSALASITCVQEQLALFNYDAGKIDGVLGPRTRAVAQGFASDYGLDMPAVTSNSSDAWCAALKKVALGAGSDPIDPELLEFGAPDQTDSPICTTNPPDGYARQISHVVEGDELTLRVSARFGGAVESVMWRNKEFINIFDHGRQISYAWAMNWRGECYNPTEPGSAHDGFAQTSTTRLLSVCSQAPNQLTTKINPAFWLRPGETGFCDSGATSAVNSSPLSVQTFTKSIELGYAGIDNVIAFDATVTLDRDYHFNQLEIPTAYLTYEFTDFWRYNPQSGELTRPQSQDLVEPWSFVHADKTPPIISTSDGAFAMGAYTAEPIATYEILHYDVPNPSDRTSKWNMVLQELPAPAGDYTYKSFAIVGTLANVQEAMSELYKLHPTDFDPPSGFIDVADCEQIAGWAWDPKTPDKPVMVEFYALDAQNQPSLLARVPASDYRIDLAAALGDNGKHAFTVPTASILPDGNTYRFRAEAVNAVPGLPNQVLTPALSTLTCPALAE